MKTTLPCLMSCLLALTPPLVRALPNTILGAIAREQSPLDGQELSGPLLAALAQPAAELPGRWREEGQVGGSRISHLIARPRVFGAEAQLVRAFHRGETLETVEITFVDAGSYFGYLQAPADLPPDLSRREKQARIDAFLQEKQTDFQQGYLETLQQIRQALIALTGGEKPKSTRIGRTRTLRAELQEWRHEGRSLRLWADGRRLVRLTLHHGSDPGTTWMDAEIARRSNAERLTVLQQSVETRADGSRLITGVRPIPQGFQPYCGLNTLAMAARHLGLQIDEDWLAVAARFPNTGSAAGSDLPGAYQAVAAEAGFRMDRRSKLDVSAVTRALDRGLPVVVWRRYCPKRDALHSRFAREHGRDATRRLPDPHDPAEQASWPDRQAPLHASVIVGHHSERREFLFLESWSENASPRRMSHLEMTATAYLVFVFTP